MKTMERNKQEFFYALFLRKEDVIDESGYNVGKRVVYDTAVSMKANISPATGQTDVEQFGNLTDYDKVIVTDEMDCPIEESSVLFLDKNPEYDGAGNPLYDYTVKRVSKSLNSISIAVKKVTVS